MDLYIEALHSVMGSWTLRHESFIVSKAIPVTGREGP
jgi:hypothetical protein